MRVTERPSRRLAQEPRLSTDLATRTLPADATAWGLAPLGCSTCARTFLGDPRPERPCPCGAGTLERADARVPGHAPEQQIALVVSREDLAARIARHLGQGWLRDRSLDPAAMAERAVCVWCPSWLVDATVRSAFSAEAGFDYEARSTVEVLQGSSWKTIERVEPRIRWEPRAGTLERRYDNVAVPALRRVRVLDRIGSEQATTAAFRGLPSRDDLILLPDLGPSDVWAGVEPAFRAHAAVEIERASQAQHIRDVHLSPTFHDQHWTVRLRPVWWAAGTGSDGLSWPVLIDGVTGQTWGPVPSSMQRAQLWAAGLAAAGFVLLGVTALLALVGVVLVFALAVVPFTGVAGAVLLLAAIAPPLSAWMHNRSARPELERLP